jgi:uncharacterized protein YegJ (DUF2314 family)
MYLVIPAIILLAAGLWLFWRWRRRRESRLVSLVGLLREPISVDAAVLAQVAGRAWNADLGFDGTEGTDGYVVATGSPGMIMCRGRFYLIHSVPAPYVENPQEAAESIGDLRTRRLFREHRAWFSCDSLGVDGRTPSEEVAEEYRRLGKLFSEFLDENCLLIYVPETQHAWPINEETERALTAANPIAALQESLNIPVTEVSDDDPRMKEAVAKARKTWPEFLAAFEAQTGETFSIKAPVSGGGNTEFIWITVTSTEGDQIFGTLGNDPVNLGSLKLGSKVAVKLSDLNDWCYIDRNGDIQGAFTLAVLQNAARKR